ncbi:aspartate dehydrogenase [Neobacillus sp. 179-C4.2 HS]|jgi:aspartate dehydrogenase|uniref:L-aspartate dehydrogenase n=1 Tax=Neobacillus driksii TaxID=3035913 RepID=A0ABV4YQ33_9BACI|nr:aspartate dehydrogenase [Neobacillus sp. 179.-C4.2 HS]MDP5193706.1 aspartate dehydrogenase [Neobacillus sp. 179.-C4.2 HS]
MKIGLIGGGNIGKFLLQSINTHKLLEDSKIIGIYTRNPKSAQQLAAEYDTAVFENIESLLQSDVDLVVEAATVEVVKQNASSILSSGKDLVLSSVGALSDLNFIQSLEKICKVNGKKIHLPSGAIGGLDVLKAAKSNGELESVSIITRKPPQALPGAPLDKEQVLFEGSAREAIELFPKNINVSIILSLAGLGPEKTRVKIISDPSIKKNSHCIEAKGSFGDLSIKVENDPMPNNPKTSYLAALSVLSSLKNKDAVIQVG